jgi:hypothetical protein
MKTLFIQIVVTGLYILAASAIGYWMSRRRRPYGWIKTTVHILLVAGVLAGWVSCLYNLQALAQPRLSTSLFVISKVLWILMGVTILANLFLWITMLIRKQLRASFPTLKWTSTAIMFSSLFVVGAIIALS